MENNENELNPKSTRISRLFKLNKADGEIDYNKEILVSLLDDKRYTLQDLLKNPSSEGEAVEQFRGFIENFGQNCQEGKSYPCIPATLFKLRRILCWREIIFSSSVRQMLPK